MNQHNERGTALIAAMLITMMVSALLVGVTTQVVSDNRTRYADRERTQAFYGAQAGLEQLVANVGNLFTTNYAPTTAQIDALATTPPSLPGITFNSVPNQPGFHIQYDDVNPADGRPDTETRTISSGPYQGFVGLITQYTLASTAKSTGNAEVRLSRTVQTVGIPVFQFGIFSENNLGFHAGDDFSFGGRVHSNQNIFIAAVTGATLTLSDKVTSVLNIIRTNFANGRSTSAAGYNGNIRMAKAPGCPAPPTAINSACRNLTLTEGSLTGDVGSAANSGWTSLSLGTYNGYIRTGLTGARRLDLPLVRDGAVPIDIIRRPNPLAPDLVTVAAQRYYNMASLRILLSDTSAEITALPGVVGTPVSLEALALAGGAGGFPLAASTGVQGNGYRSVANTPLLGGFILINKQDTAGNWTDVTNNVLSLGVSGRNLSNGTINVIGACAEPYPNAIIRIQRVKDVPAMNAPCGAASTNATDYWPNTIYDPREGLRRDNEATGQNELYLGGIMHYIEFDVDNYRRWLANLIGAGAGTNSQNVTGFVVYFSDRRGNKDAANLETGEFGWEDVVNTNSTGTPNGTLQTGEDFNGNGTLQTYGNTPRVTWTVAVPNGAASWGTGSAIDGTVNVHTSRVNKVVARANRTPFFRRALKLVNGGLGALPSVGSQGLTIASENPVYIEGNYNACGAPTANCAAGGFGAVGDAHRSAAVIADSVTLLSRSWNDMNSYNSPHNPAGRLANTTWYRTAIISGKGINFPHPGNGEFANFGSDGGAHNFLRFMENWSSNNPTIFYRGSMISFYYSRQAVGTWKCCVNIYTPPSRGASFDTEFLTPSLLPPRTPMFRDVNSTGFTQTTSPCGTDATCGAVAP